MVSKAVKAGLLVLAGVGGVIVVTEIAARGNQVKSVNRLKIEDIFFDEVTGAFDFFEKVKLNIEGTDIGTAFFYMQTRSLIDGTVSDLQIQEVNLRQGARESSFVVEWRNTAIGQGAIVEFFIFDSNNVPLSEDVAVTIGS